MKTKNVIIGIVVAVFIISGLIYGATTVIYNAYLKDNVLLGIAYGSIDDAKPCKDYDCSTESDDGSEIEEKNESYSSNDYIDLDDEDCLKDNILKAIEDYKNEFSKGEELFLKVEFSNEEIGMNISKLQNNIYKFDYGYLDEDNEKISYAGQCVFDAKHNSYGCDSRHADKVLKEFVSKFENDCN